MTRLITYPNRLSKSVDLFDNFFNDEFFNNFISNNKDGHFSPQVDVAETDAQFEFQVALPGLKKDDIKVQIEEGRLTISGERKFENEESGKKYHRVESRYGSFSRTFQLPDNINEDSLKAKFEDGLLNISVEKEEKRISRAIEIE